jgi:hypothetical protein
MTATFWPGVIVGAVACVLVAALTVYAMTLWIVRDERKRKRLAARPVCGCRHHLSFHKDGTGRCNFVVNEFHNIRCGCRAYVGPAVTGDTAAHLG